MNQTSRLMCAWILLAAGGGSAIGEETASVVERSLNALALLKRRAEVSDTQVTKVLEPALAALNGADAGTETRLKSGKPMTPIERAELLGRRCGWAYLRGELYRAAAEVPPESSGGRDDYAQKAIATFRSMRLEYRDGPAGQMGYIGETRMRRAIGEMAGAQAALEPLLKENPRQASTGELQVRRLALVERVANAIAADPARGLAEAQATLRRAEFRGRDALRDQIEWLVAKAKAKVARDEPQALEAAHLLRSESVVAAQPGWERLALLAGLEAKTPGKVMSGPEWVSWAQMLAQAGRQDQAIQAFGAADARAEDLLTPSQRVMYGRLLLEASDTASAGKQFRLALKMMEDSDAQRTDALRLLGAALTQSLRGSPGDEHLRREACDVLLTIARGDAPTEVRRSALRQWVSLKGSGDPTLVVETLGSFADLSRDDPAVNYALLAARWRRLASAGASAELQRQARELADGAGALRGAAMKAGQEPLVAAATLLHATVLGSPVVKDSAAALRSLESEWARIDKQPGLLPAALSLRVRLLLELGLTDVAARLVSDHPKLPLEPAILMDLATAMAQRYDAGAPDAQLRGDVTALVQRALSTVKGDDQRAALTRGGAGALIEVEAFADAQKLLAGAGGDDDERSMLLEARALSGKGDQDAAIVLLKRAAERFPDSPEPLMELGDMRKSLGQHAKALECYRGARRLSRPGSHAWWEATAAVAESLDRTGQRVEARHVLRAAAALEPTPARATLSSRIEALRKSLEQPR